MISESQIMYEDVCKFECTKETLVSLICTHINCRSIGIVHYNCIHIYRPTTDIRKREEICAP